MRAFLTALLLLFPASALAGWQEVNVIGVRTDNSKAPTVIFINTYTGTGPAPGVWHQIDVTALGVPADAKAAFLSGILIISHGTTAQTCDLTVSLRAPGDDLLAGNYIGQTIETAVGGGQRSNMSSWVPLVGGKFEFQWNRNTYGPWPSECSYGINLSLQAYGRAVDIGGGPSSTTVDDVLHRLAEILAQQYQ
jgi:hypothetical protein